MLGTCSAPVSRPHIPRRIPYRLPFFRAEHHSLLPADLENFARVAYEVVVILSVEKQSSIYTWHAWHSGPLRICTLILFWKKFASWYDSHWDSRLFVYSSQRDEHGGGPAVLVSRNLIEALRLGPLLRIRSALDFRFPAAFHSCSVCQPSFVMTLSAL